MHGEAGKMSVMKALVQLTVTELADNQSYDNKDCCAVLKVFGMAALVHGQGSQLLF